MKLLTFLAGIFCLPALAMTTHFSSQEIEFMKSFYQQENSDITYQEVEKQLLEDQFLLSEAKLKQPHLLVRQSNVGFDTKFHVRRYLSTLLTPLIPTIKAKFKDIKTLNITQNELQFNLGQYPNDGMLSDIKIEKLKQVQLISNPSYQISLAQIYLSLSMQSRFKLHQGDMKELLRQVNQTYHFEQLKHLSQPILKDKNLSYLHLNSIALAYILRTPMQNYFGITDLMHSQSITLDRLSKNVSKAEIADYYKNNMQRFKYLAQVHSHAIFFNTQEEATDFYIKAKSSSWHKNINDNNLVDIFSIYQNKLTRALTESDWSIQTAFNLRDNTISPPIRSPKGRWLVVNNGDKNYDIYPLNTETVRYQAIKSIAKRTAQQHYDNKLKNWLAHKL
ncbi:peptidyl-prolyl cis-trans isomerase [Pseudoalteromonas denitrificans]|jgi:hypothetical protein|uniref:PPIC-type PPIASE domain-containing protein n=1 Tax=Pseudoalteromonas denitrificans DSM 6059 TaxID=1123010 RepID=A0A1I1S462_9GAMM|nr:peptidylprolyl isomerase [Pseudoalteromonas denitrificans]SFD41384.1 PPIC-type PPIASE domain-containing protein [Pseudoalteromonas denitrificans DSM 6059]